MWKQALVGAFNQEKALIGAFSVIVKTDCETDGSSQELVTIFVTCCPSPTLLATAPEQEVSCSGSVVGRSRVGISMLRKSTKLHKGICPKRVSYLVLLLWVIKVLTTRIAPAVISLGWTHLHKMLVLSIKHLNIMMIRLIKHLNLMISTLLQQFDSHWIDK